LSDPEPIMKRVPEIDLSSCTLCEGCQALCPEVFRLNPAGYMEVAELDEYPEDCVQEAMIKCPAGCIAWTQWIRK